MFYEAGGDNATITVDIESSNRLCMTMVLIDDSKSILIVALLNHHLINVLLQGKLPPINDYLTFCYIDEEKSSQSYFLLV
jgi:hypothetical protein